MTVPAARIANEIGARLRDETGPDAHQALRRAAGHRGGKGPVASRIAEQAAEAGVTEATVLVCCGGGGFTAGIALALEARAPGMRVHPVEPAGFDDTARSLASGGIVRNEGPEAGFCDAILTPAPGGDHLSHHVAALRTGDRRDGGGGAPRDAPCIRSAEGRGGARRAPWRWPPRCFMAMNWAMNWTKAR